MATVAGGYKVNAAINVSNTIIRTTTGTSSGSFYTAPSNGFAIITVVEMFAQTVTTPGVAGSQTMEIRVGGASGVPLVIKTTGAGGTIVYFANTVISTAGTGSPATVIYLGPGQDLYYLNSLNVGAGGGQLNVGVKIFGVEYTNV